MSVEDLQKKEAEFESEYKAKPVRIEPALRKIEKMQQLRGRESDPC